VSRARPAHTCCGAEASDQSSGQTSSNVGRAHAPESRSARTGSEGGQQDTIRPSCRYRLPTQRAAVCLPGSHSGDASPMRPVPAHRYRRGAAWNSVASTGSTQKSSAGRGSRTHRPCAAESRLCSRCGGSRAGRCQLGWRPARRRSPVVVRPVPAAVSRDGAGRRWEERAGQSTDGIAPAPCCRYPPSRGMRSQPQLPSRR
jgi:hypothetical protein